MGILGVYQDGKKSSKITFPVTKPGKSSQIKVIVRNESFNFCEIKTIRLFDTEVTVQGHPNGLEPGKEEPMFLTWTPVLSSEKPLKTRIEFDEVLG